MSNVSLPGCCSCEVGGKELDWPIASLMPLMRSMGSWLILCLSSNPKCEKQHREKGILHPWPVPQLGQLRQWGCGTQEGVTDTWWDGLERDKGGGEFTLGLSASLDTKETEFVTEFHLSHANEWIPVTLLYDLLKIYFQPTYARHWQQRKTSLSFYCPPKNNSLFLSVSAMEAKSLFFLRWHGVLVSVLHIL